MHIKTIHGWQSAERDVTDEAIVLNRRHFMVGAGAIAGSAGLGLGLAPSQAHAANTLASDLYPAKRNEVYKLTRPITPEDVNASYNNFYEFGSHKGIARTAQALKLQPWQIRIDGLVEKPMTMDFTDLVRKFPLEERLYRHRCVEAWSMTVPWTGFGLKELVKFANPLSTAKYIRMESFKNPKMARGQRASWYPWPYVEGLTIAEATNDLTFMVTGAYGKPLAKQFGAPIRLHVPWKYGFKSNKSIMRFTFTDKRPKSFWETIQASEYGFWANVNPKVPHRRWSQATERVLGTKERIPTQIYNGYGEWVAELYKNMKGEKLFM